MNEITFILHFTPQLLLSTSFLDSTTIQQLNFLCEEGTTQTMGGWGSWGAADSGKTMLNKTRGQGDKKRTSFEKQKWC